MSETVSCTLVDGVAHVTLNLPEKRNALVPELADPLIATLEALQGDDACRSILLAGAGTAFCAGGDLSGLDGDDPMRMLATMQDLHRIIRALVAGRKATVAAVDGAAFGAGLSLALACDIVVAGPAARFCAAFGRVGLIPDLGLLWTLPQRLGAGAARELMMLCEVLDAGQAHTAGLVDHLSPDGALVVATEKARRLAKAAPEAIALTKAALAHGPQGLDPLLDFEAQAQALLLAGADYARARTAFLTKAPAPFLQA